jgi:uncharacterized protein (DUF433 family)
MESERCLPVVCEPRDLPWGRSAADSGILDRRGYTVPDKIRRNPMSLVQKSHIQVDPSGVAWIDDSNVKVIEVVVDKLAHGSSAEEMHFQYPHLSLAQIYAALSHYHDHQDEFDQEVAAQLRDVDALEAAARNSPVRKRLREAGKLP